ncbi:MULTISPECIES: nucleotide sugar dehydrogenase [Silvimonas]|uniref:nucleotide sugar dehydrogenase n=1 Tax=Silvimonas TaxID=300264 RepID=UPI0024B34A13|nr:MULTISPECIES: UDP-glucose/GDP-mannose dehydrogenase family protein [Silvimonas]MDR3427048.1 UDP-glucose/GDP-mannose dehydrogenase family protein [Silvimonas sp.]
MKISIFGLGYVGVVAAGCLAGEGHTVIGVEPNASKVDLINRGIPPIVEKDIAELVSEAVSAGRLRGTTDVHAAVLATEMSFICVGTPSQLNGALDLRYVRRVCEEIGAALKEKSDFHIVVARSTMLPGTMKDVVIPTLEQHSGKKAGVDFGVCNNPEFLREGTAVWDYRNPPKTVLGQTDVHSGDVLAGLYSELKAPLIRTDIETAEMVKYVDNVWHALKVSFANEIGNICKGLEIDSHQVMDIFCKDTKLNLSPYYLKPGFAFGGSCLPKDVRALNYKARSLDLELPILSAILPSNDRQVERGYSMITAKGKRKIGVLGFSFKAGTDDLRESPIVEVIERLIGKGYDLKLYDRNVNLAALTGANKDYIFNMIPHISRIMEQSLDAVLDHAEVLVIGNNAPEFKDAFTRLRPNQEIIDFVRVVDHKSEEGKYDGICW